jgi:hypothetical protein
MAIRQSRRLIVALVLGVGGCTGPAAPSVTSVAGSWSGTTNPPHRASAFAISVTISQSGALLSGTWGTNYNGGTVNGEINGARVSMILTTTHLPSPCPSFSIMATVDGNRMSGTTHGVDCPSTGSIELTKY